MNEEEERAALFLRALEAPGAAREEALGADTEALALARLLESVDFSAASRARGPLRARLLAKAEAAAGPKTPPLAWPWPMPSGLFLRAAAVLAAVAVFFALNRPPRRPFEVSIPAPKSAARPRVVRPQELFASPRLVSGDSLLLTRRVAAPIAIAVGREVERSDGSETVWTVDGNVLALSRRRVSVAELIGPPL